MLLSRWFCRIVSVNDVSSQSKNPEDETFYVFISLFKMLQQSIFVYSASSQAIKTNSSMAKLATQPICY